MEINNNYSDPFSVCFNSLKLRYKDYDESISSKNFLNPTDKINVFINLETVYKSLSTILDLEKKILLQRQFEEIMISNIINLAAHYKRFFVNNGLDTKVYLYNTDFTSTEFNQYKYNEDYRSYYLQKFNGNPKFVLFTERMVERIIPNVRTYCEFIPNVYYISSKNIEGSLIPYIISQFDTTRKNFIVGGEFYDTQYSVIPNFVNHYIHRSFANNAVYSDIKGYLKGMSKSDDIMSPDIFDKYPMYCALVSVIGDKSRSIDGITGCGLKTLQRYIDAGLQQNLIQLTTSNPMIIGDIFHDCDVKEEFVNNFYCSSILSMYDELTSAEKSSISSQIVDRMDFNSLFAINNTKFYSHPMILEALF